MRAASTACTESGTVKPVGIWPKAHDPFCRVRTPRSTNVAMSSSTKKGFPSARSTTRVRIWSGISARRSSPSRRRASVQELRSRGGEQEKGTRHLRDERVDQVAQLILGPVQVLDEEDDRLVT